MLTSIQLLMAEPNPEDPLVAEIVIMLFCVISVSISSYFIYIVQYMYMVHLVYLTSFLKLKGIKSSLVLKINQQSYLTECFSVYTRAYQFKLFSFSYNLSFPLLVLMWLCFSSLRNSNITDHSFLKKPRNGLRNMQLVTEYQLLQ